MEYYKAMSRNKLWKKSPGDLQRETGLVASVAEGISYCITWFHLGKILDYEIARVPEVRDHRGSVCTVFLLCL